ncbi:hypothetical protein FF1_022514 [Malus domestica]|uniref:uncharacterized protein n=1 Tax=Malus domestica TaxID=3750 RepID=UPI003975599A
MESSVLLTAQPHPWRPNYSFHFICQNPLPSSHLSRSYAPSYRRWDSNAETIRSQRFGFNFRDKGNGEKDEDDDEDEEDYEYSRREGKKKRRWWSDESSEMEEEGSGGILEDAIDSVWIFKVFKSYGWAFPAIIISLLLSTGPKAFIMALALPLVQSAFSLLYEKLWGGTQSRPKRKSRTRRRRKPFASTVGNARTKEKEKYDEEQETSDKRMGYQSWVVGNDASADSSGRDASSLGGWDDLERMESARRQSQRKPMGKGKLSRRERNSDTPLLLRLLIAVFPFLGTWTKMFW